MVVFLELEVSVNFVKVRFEGSEDYDLVVK